MMRLGSPARIWMIGLLLPLGLASAGAGYEVVDVADGGTVAGIVTLNGPVPDAPPIEIGKDVEHCGTIQPSNMYVVGEDGQVANALVIVEDVAAGRAVPEKVATEIDNVNCAFVPLVGIAYVGGTFVIRNSDPILHNTHLSLSVGEQERTLYNLALPRPDTTVKKRVKRPGMVKVSCDVHPWMRAYIWSSDHPYVAVTGEDGKFEMTDLPAGSYTLSVWHEGLGEQKVPFEVSAGATTELAVAFASGK